VANLDRPFGLRFHSMLTGDAANVSMRRYRLAAADTTAVYVGDPVVLSNATDNSAEAATLADQTLNQMDGVRYVRIGTSGAALVGVVAGFAYDPTSLTSTYRTTAQVRDVYVIDDPNAIFEAQSDVTGIARATMNDNCNFTITAGNAYSGVSKTVVTTAANTATASLKIMGYVLDGKNDITSAGYVKVLVKINNHQYGSHTGTAGATT
jgi:hypothetical protein